MPAAIPPRIIPGSRTSPTRPIPRNATTATSPRSTSATARRRSRWPMSCARLPRASSNTPRSSSRTCTSRKPPAAPRSARSTCSRGDRRFSVPAMIKINPQSRLSPGLRLLLWRRLSIVWAGGILIAASVAAYLALPPPNLDRSLDLSALVLARDGSILRGFLSVDGKWRLPVTADQVDPLYRRMLVAAEDRRFARHPGIDPIAVLRALGQLVRSGRIVSGASTLTMQAVRLLERRPRTLPAKLIEMAEALGLERRLGKNDILALYLTLAPFGGNLEGVRAASLAYFAKEPSHLSPA